MASITSRNLFVGYSTVATPKGQKLVDIKLVEQDLLNHFNTRKNERVMMPGWGCGIWDYLFEPLEYVRNEIIEEARRIVESDSRVIMKDIEITDFDHGIKIDMTLYYKPLNAIGNFSIDFDRRSQAD